MMVWAEPEYRPPDARRAIHLVLVASLAWVAFVLANSGQTAFGMSSSFYFMQRVADENHWAILLFGLAGCGCWGLITRSWITRLLSAGLVTIGHASVAICFVIGMIGHPLAPGAGLYVGMTYLGFYLTWRYRR